MSWVPSIYADGADRLRSLPGIILDDNGDVPVAVAVDELSDSRLLPSERVVLVRPKSERAGA